MKWPSEPQTTRRWYSAYEQCDPFVRMIVECESELSIQITCPDDACHDAFIQLEKKSGLNYVACGICREGLIAGTALPFLRITCPKCSGSLMDPDAEECDHKGGEVSSIELLDQAMIHEAVDGTFSLIPNSELQYVVFNRRPQDVYEKIAPFVKRLILEGRLIPISPHAVSKLEAPSMVRNIMDGCPNPVAAALADMWRLKVYEWIKNVLVEKICKMKNLKVPVVELMEPKVRTLQKYAGMGSFDWKQVRNSLK